MRGPAISVSNNDLDAIAAAYSADDAPAPFVLGHPKTEDMAHGWVKRLYRDGDILFAEPGEISDDLKKHVEAGRFKKVSASFFKPGGSANPSPENYYLKHVGFLGAVPPAVTGLAPVSFAGEESGTFTVEFGSHSDRMAASAWGRLRDFIIEKFSLADADEVLPTWIVDDLKDSARPDPEPSPSFSTPPSEAAIGDSMTEEEIKKREAELAAREEQLKEKEVSFAEASATAVATAEAKEFAGELVQAGKLLPAQEQNVVAFMASLNNEDSVSFAEGSEKSQVAFFKEFLNGLPKAVEFSEITGDAGDEAAATASFAAPDGAAIDQERLAIHTKAQAYQSTHEGVSYVDAVKAVSGE